jgi:hypothetical protein
LNYSVDSGHFSSVVNTTNINEAATNVAVENSEMEPTVVASNFADQDALINLFSFIESCFQFVSNPTFYKSMRSVLGCTNNGILSSIKQWTPLYIEKLIELSSMHPHLSGLHRLLHCILRYCGWCFSDNDYSVKNYALLQRLRECLLKLQSHISSTSEGGSGKDSITFSDELLETVLKLLLQSGNPWPEAPVTHNHLISNKPDSFSSSLLTLSELAPAIIVSLRSGLQVVAQYFFACLTTLLS